MRTLPLLLALASTVLAQGTPSAQSVLDRYIEVTGGQSAYEKVKTMTATGTMEITGQNVRGDVRMYRADGSKYYQVVELPGIGKQEDGSNGAVVWDKTVLGPRIKTGAEKFLATCARGALSEYGRGALEKDSCYSKVDYVGTETLNGKAVHRLRLTPKEGKPEEHFFEKDTGLLLMTRMVLPSPMGEIPITTTVMEYRKVEGITTPVKLKNEMGAVAMVLAFNSVKFNEAIPEAMFALPPEIAALAKAAKQ
jgi:hypothetical protein